jgi:hypothetical protein
VNREIAAATPSTIPHKTRPLVQLNVCRWISHHRLVATTQSRRIEVNAEYFDESERSLPIRGFPTL